MTAASTFLRVVAESGLTKPELAQLYGVSRQTIFNWRAGTWPWPGTMPARQADAISAALLTAIERGLLPLAAMSKEARRARVTKMAATVQALKLPPVR